MAVDLRPNLYALYHLNEELGSVAYDSSGNGRNGTLVNMEDVHWVAGKLNNCLAFPGVDEYINCGQIANFEKDEPFSLECWFKTDGTNHLIFGKITSVNGTGYYAFTAIGKIYFKLAYSSVDKIYVNTSSDGFNDNIFHQLILTYDGSGDANGCHIYIDHEDQILHVSSNTLTGNITNDANFNIGIMNNLTYPFNGKQDEIVIYDKELSQEEVTFRWNNGDGREDFLEGPEPVTVSFTIKDDCELCHISNVNIKVGQEDWIKVHSPFDLDIAGHVDIKFDKGGYETQVKHVEAEEHVENIVLEHCAHDADCIYYKKAGL